MHTEPRRVFVADPLIYRLYRVIHVAPAHRHTYRLACFSGVAGGPAVTRRRLMPEVHAGRLPHEHRLLRERSQERSLPVVRLLRRHQHPVRRARLRAGR